MEQSVLDDELAETSDFFGESKHFCLMESKASLQRITTQYLHCIHATYWEFEIFYHWMCSWVFLWLVQKEIDLIFEDDGNIPKTVHLKANNIDVYHGECSPLMRREEAFLRVRYECH